MDPRSESGGSAPARVPLGWVVRSGRMPELAAALGAGADPREVDGAGMCPLAWAAARADDQAAALLLSGGASAGGAGSVSPMAALFRFGPSDCAGAARVARLLSQASGGNALDPQARRAFALDGAARRSGLAALEALAESSGPDGAAAERLARECGLVPCGFPSVGARKERRKLAGSCRLGRSSAKGGL